MTGKLSAVSLFSGCGGFDWGARQAGVELIWANDINPHSAYAYKSLFPEAEFHLNDIAEVATFPQADVLIGCYPCTGFSVAARRRWRNREQRDLKKNDTNYLYLEFLRALKIVKPKYLFVENVRGMKSANGGWFLEQQLNGFRECGYKVIDPQVLDASNFGVAQTRKRIFIVGVRDDIDYEYSYPTPTHGKSQTASVRTLFDVIGNMDLWPEGEYLDYKFHGHYLTRNRKRKWSDPSYTIVADAHHIPLHPMGDPMKFVEKDTWQLQGQDNRRLSWRECAAIQDLPKHIEISGSLSDKYKVVGNSVPPKLGYRLLKPIVEFEQSIAPPSVPTPAQTNELTS